MVDTEDDEALFAGDAESVLKVGATIKSTRGPQPLWDILKRLAALKDMNVSWASDVDQNVLVDVDISAGDDFYKAIDNLLRQVDYFHEMQGNTIVVKYKEVRQFRIAMPFVKSSYKTGTGGNVLGGNDASSNIDGTIELKSDENDFDIWDNIKNNMDTIIGLWSTEAVTEATDGEAAEEEGEGDAADATQQATRQVSSGGVAYVIDKPVGIVTVTAPRPLLDELQKYFDNLTNELYKQIAIEAKIIEVQLVENSSVGINWTQVLRNFNVTGTGHLRRRRGPATRGRDKSGRMSAPTTPPLTTEPSTATFTIATRFVSRLALAPPISVFLNALETQGDTQVLSNPKISVINGQPALLTVGRNVTYIESIDADLDTETGLITYSTETARSSPASASS